VPVGVLVARALAYQVRRGRAVLEGLIALPLVLPPTVLGFYLLTLLAPGTVAGGWWFRITGETLAFSFPGLVLGSMLYSLPFAVQPLVAAFRAVPGELKDAARSLGAGGLRVFLRVTLPKIRWGLIYGVILCNARAMGEFGAVSVVSGHIRGLTNTMPLQVEILYNEYQTGAAFAVASLLALFGIFTLLGETLLARLRGQPTKSH
jgi:sulfate transport system permease protein